MSDVQVPRVAQEAFHYLSVEDKLDVLYTTLIQLQDYVVDLEKKASAMTSPEALQGMMSNFMGGGLFG